ncbi:hypothetical protein UCDDA912_g04505 [Diaporthe ampelina]|uniref:Apple domain-containing protein n=1 Tax=Diaporthe ampelina TaxID=1214573 RepID=A0A0G2FNE9_9PEZI|nr:hypothetical protein UCDDA912_g04505 [Diaporthe ampelina]
MPSIQNIVILAAMASSALASPLLARDSCNVTPSASGSQTPISEPSVTTAELCKEECEANTSCKSFVFGLPEGATSPTCKLYSVSASQVPTQETNLNDDCLALCKQTTGCESVEFGTFNGATECRLFDVPASQLPAATNGQSFVAYDKSC